MHGIYYDEIHDEIVVTQPNAHAVLTFRGAANGEEAPIRVIQGSLTQLGFIGELDKLAIDPVHNETFVPVGADVLVFPREANGNVAPIRVLKEVSGPNTYSAPYIAVDPLNNLILVLGRDGVLMFDRTAQGNATPRGVISGPKTHLNGGGRIFAYPSRREIILIGTGAVDGTASGADGGGPTANASGGFVSVWSIDDKGDVAPRRWRLGLPESSPYDPAYYGSMMGAGIDPKNKSIMVANKLYNAVLTYSFPEIF